ncbi:molybdenum cofactor guanylyltransferase [Methanolobus bombayensis]|uniref:molybdenum cofactor guanylyltransferase n=1 Tax=Methanolobus bombayensis TaxID=38023 RepID=UPI001AE9F40C|nr:molybdenum cofactor guanylyltransferase [Methanolobus bombayensis]MBP1909473.1 molybdopterin-guanine dinucleotide biosynthesis protein A [Methanolobus bombayensis]
MIKRSSLLLAGGLGTRMNGREKALMMFENNTLLERSLSVLDDVSDEVIISLRDEEQVHEFSSYLHNRKVVTDRIKNTGPLAGMLSGFERAYGEYVFTVACDMPYLNRALIDMMFNMVGEHDALIPISEYGTKEPLHAVYKRDTMLEAIENALNEGNRSILSPVSFLDNVIYLESEIIRTIDQDFKSFVNINTPSDMLKLE